MRPNIACRSCRLTSSCSSTRRSAIVLKASPRSPSSSSRSDVDARVELAGGDGLRAALQRQDRLDEAAAEEVADRDHDEQRDGDRDDELARAARWRWRRPRAVGCSTITVQPSGGDAGGDAELRCGRPRRCIPATPARRRCGARAAANERMAAHVARLRDQRLLVGIAVRDQLAVRGDDQRVAVLADADAIDHPPHFFEAELAGQPAGRLVEVRQVDGEHRRSAAGPRRRGSATSRRRRSSAGGPWESRRAACRRGSRRSSRPARRTA